MTKPDAAAVKTAQSAPARRTTNAKKIEKLTKQHYIHYTVMFIMFTIMVSRLAFDLFLSTPQTNTEIEPETKLVSVCLA